jgi:hypothetical protein
MRYKKTLLEGRGFGPSTITSTAVMMNNTLGPTGSENVWCRVITITGTTKMYWAADVTERVAATTFAFPTDYDGLKVSQVGMRPSRFSPDLYGLGFEAARNG